MDFTGWPSWLILAAFIFTLSGNKHFLRLVDRVSARLGIASRQREDKELEAERWMREQAEKNQERFIGILESTIRDFRKQSEGRDKTMVDMIMSLQKSAEATRLLAQKMIGVREIVNEVQEMVRDIKTTLAETQKIEARSND